MQTPASLRVESSAQFRSIPQRLCPRTSADTSVFLSGTEVAPDLQKIVPRRRTINGWTKTKAAMPCDSLSPVPCFSGTPLPPPYFLWNCETVNFSEKIGDGREGEQQAQAEQKQRHGVDASQSDGPVSPAPLQNSPRD